MCPSEREDYLMRQLRAVGAMLARIMGLRVSGHTGEAAGELDSAYRELLGPDRSLFAALDVPGVALLLADPEKVALYAALILEEARLTGGKDAPGLETRALDLAQAALAEDPDNPVARRIVEQPGDASRPDLRG